MIIIKNKAQVYQSKKSINNIDKFVLLTIIITLRIAINYLKKSD